ncbi:unnamed protein product [Polarella glacialis]|uniref:Large ribosomal subunit protein uL15/eL18 domain-containing protein n=1 Tax=Polarella glacialis TaxID=89957 RepID=A0A813GNS0_POLGL|nr:unnamed protein product [Polarella glacialis]
MTARLKKNRGLRGHVSAGRGRIGKHRKHPGGCGNAGGQHHHRINFDKYHPGWFGKVGMRNFHLIKHGKVTPTINVERLWSLVSEQTRAYYKEKTDKAPVIDVMKAGYMKVMGKGKLPEQPVIVKARYFTKEAEEKIKAAGGVCVLCVAIPVVCKFYVSHAFSHVFCLVLTKGQLGLKLSVLPAGSESASNGVVLGDAVCTGEVGQSEHRDVVAAPRASVGKRCGAGGSEEDAKQDHKERLKRRSEARMTIAEDGLAEAPEMRPTGSPLLMAHPSPQRKEFLKRRRDGSERVMDDTELERMWKVKVEPVDEVDLQRRREQDAEEDPETCRRFLQLQESEAGRNAEEKAEGAEAQHTRHRDSVIGVRTHSTVAGESLAVSVKPACRALQAGLGKCTERHGHGHEHKVGQSSPKQKSGTQRDATHPESR